MRSKYGNRKVKADGYTFDSKAEYYRYQALKILAGLKHIKNLQVHPRYEIMPGFIYNGKKYRPIYYIADFAYDDIYRATEVVEDVKGVRTAVFNLKEKLFLKLYGENIKFKIIK